MIKIAPHTPSGRMLHVDHAVNGAACHCKCPECGEDLIAVHPKQNQSHYRHDSNVNCLGAQESALHKYGKQIIFDHNEMMIPSEGRLVYEDVRLEPRVGVFRADARILANGQEYFCEVVVKNEMKAEKEFFYENTNRKCIEIDLRRFIDTNYSYEEIINAVLSDVSNKRLIHKKVNLSKSEWTFGEVLLVVVLAVLGIRWLTRRL